MCLLDTSPFSVSSSFLSPHRGIGPHLSAFPALSSHAFTHLPCIRKGSPLNLFPYPPQRGLGETSPKQGRGCLPIFRLPSSRNLSGDGSLFRTRSKEGPARSGCPVRGRIAHGGHGLPLSSAPLPVFRHTKRPHGHIRRTASPRVSDARGMEKTLILGNKRRQAGERGRRNVSVLCGKASPPLFNGPLRPQQTPPTVSACWSCSSRTASCAASNLRRLSSKSRM